MITQLPRTPSISAPSSPSTGQSWDEVDNSGLLKGQWFWNGSLWISRQLYQQGIPFYSGQGVVLGGAIGLWSNTTDAHPLLIGNDSDIYLYKIHAAFNTASALSASNYWQLQFKNNSILQTLNINSGTGLVRKSSPVINTKYTNSNFNLVLAKNGLAPNINAASALIEYRLCRP